MGDYINSVSQQLNVVLIRTVKMIVLKYKLWYGTTDVTHTHNRITQTIYLLQINSTELITEELCELVF